MKELYHIGITPAQGAGYAILPGDPGRVEQIASFLDAPRPLGQNREYTSFEGFLEGERVIVMSTGMGGPSAAICLEELADAGLHTAIRLGSCGGISTEVIPGDLVIPTAAVRMEGTTKEYAPPEYPAAGDFTVLTALAESARTLGYPFRIGVVQSKDSFYGQHRPETMPTSSLLLEKWEAWKRLGVLASEMETAALYTVGAFRKVRVGCVLNAFWNQERAKAGFRDPDVFDMTPSIQTVILALRRLILEKRQETVTKGETAPRE